MQNADAHCSYRLVIARCAIGLLIAGLALPLVLSVLWRKMYSSDETIELYVMLSGTAVFLAFALGYLGRHHLSGKMAMIGAITVIALVFLFGVLR